MVITGGGTGIGRATARAFAEQGAGVLVVGRTESTLAETARGHDGIEVLAVDITAPEAPDLVVARALRAFGRIDALVNNATAARFAPLEEVDRASARTQLDTILLGPIFLTQRAVEPLAESGGTVVNVSSAGSLGRRSWPAMSVHGAGKVGLDFLTRCWAVELAPRGIRVVSVAPGVIDTGIGERIGMSGDAYAGFLEEMRRRIPAGRVGRPEEVAWWITQLTRPEAEYATGMVLALDGALSIV
ncbi:ketoreductase [Marinitenerispora sediminis]|uniref:Ketoreductase n=1 Tax=Marinitenerispora sediminis TaxID=1931232 RepID=A0A368SZ04_9ACTN|nr:ketoreductase [Marinitenerispora sediminis]RCV48303.1 ketoreductase [Marinitenerispora sediminis]RCV50242.1 ketoreductase [Marinitenerispora sediminis]